MTYDAASTGTEVLGHPTLLNDGQLFLDNIILSNNNNIIIIDIVSIIMMNFVSDSKEFETVISGLLFMVRD